ncbi:MAG: hypothetical protein HYU63_00955 [Armatimonadetes bacterium]|nr:hypothetical protein [Armatimonadota bacterium]
MRKIILIFLILFSILHSCILGEEETKVNIKLLGSANPAISRFLGFAGIIPKKQTELIYKNSIKLFINDENKTIYLETQLDSKTGEIYLNYTPFQPLPLGKVVFRLTADNLEGGLFEYKWSFLVEPEKDKSLTRYFKILKKNPKDEMAHLQLAKAYENKYLLEDADFEYKNVLRLNPKNLKAKKNHTRLFALQERKFITAEKIILNVAKDSALEVLGNLLMFKIKVINQSASIIKFNPKEALLIVDKEEQLGPVENIKKYPVYAYENDIISVENYARLSHFMDTHTLVAFGESDDKKGIPQKKEIQPGISAAGYIAFSLRVPRYKELKLILPLSLTSKYKLIYKLPFSRP